MQFLKKRSVATLLAAVVICLSTLMSVHRSLGAKCAEVEAGFYDGLEGSHSSISYQLNQCARYANSLASLSANHEELEDLTSDLRAARNSLLDGGSIAEQYDAYLQLTDAFIAVKTEMDVMDLGTRTEDYEFCVNGFDGAQRTIASSGYNESVRAFQNSTLRTFPANVLYKIAGVDTPDLFS
ncbi:MAG: hypothetical protein ACOX7K_03930 [Oscillospiraceae bacterium]|jgi:hypothetical protein